MIQQDSRGANAYILGIMGLVLALFIPFAALILRIFEPLFAAFFLGVSIPLAALILGILGIIKNSKSSNHKKATKILSIITIIVSIILVAFNLYIFIKSGGLVA